MSAIAAVASAVAAILLLLFEWNRGQDFTTRQTFLAIRDHKDRMIAIGTAHTCAEAILNFSVSLQKSTRTAQGEDDRFRCEESWCDKYRHCVKTNNTKVADGDEIGISAAKAWQIALPVRKALESYDYVALMGCRNILQKDMVLEEFRTAFRKDTSVQKGTPIFVYVTSIYPPSDKGSRRQLPGLTALIGALYPSDYNHWAMRWENDCPNEP